MALKDLVAQKSAFAEEAIEAIVSDYVRYDPTAPEIVFTPEFASLNNKAKILVYLVAMQGWEFVSDEVVAADPKPAELEERLGIPGGSLRPLLKDLKDRHLVFSKGSGYSVRLSSLSAVQKELDRRTESVPSRPKKTPKRRIGSSRSSPAQSGTDESEIRQANGELPKEAKKRRASASRDLKNRFDGWVSEGFFDQPRMLSEVQSRFRDEAILVPRTSIPAYLLKAVRTGVLKRKKTDVNGKQLWIYETRKKG